MLLLLGFCTNRIEINTRHECPEPALYRTNLWERLKQVKRLSFANVSKELADKKRKADDDAALKNAMASIKIGSNLINDLKKLRISTQQTPRAGPAHVIGRHVFLNSAPLMLRGNGETFSELNLKTSQLSSSDVSHPFQREQDSFGGAQL